MTIKIEGGCTLWARKTFESDIFCLKPDKWFKIWFYIIGKVSHRDSKQYKRGEGFFKYEWIMADCKATKSQVDHFFRWAKSATMLATRKATGGLCVTVINYHLYQDIDVYRSDKRSDGGGETKAKQKRHLLYNKDKNDKNEKKDTIVSSSEKWGPIDVNLCNELVNRILKNNPKSKVRIMSKKTQETWLIESRRMREIDKRTPEEILSVIMFSQEDKFWSPVILSMAKLREKFDTLWLRAQKKDQPGLRDWLMEQNKRQEDEEDFF